VCEVHLVSDAFHVYTCTGTLITPDLVLCAAHCVDAPRIRSATCTFNERRVVAAKSWYWNKNFDQGDIESNATEHQRLSAVGLDYTILELERPVLDIEPSPMLPLSELKSLAQKGEVKELTAVGFGRFSKSEVTNLVAGVHKRSASFRSFSFPANTQTIKVRPSSRVAAEDVSIAVGDSGGPYFVRVRGVDYIAATVSTVTYKRDGNAEFATALSVDAPFNFFKRSILANYTQRVGPLGYNYTAPFESVLDKRALEKIAYGKNTCVEGYCFDERPLLYSALALLPAAIYVYIGLRLKDME